MRLSGPWFSIGFCIGYAVVFALDLPLFLYYPVPKRVVLSETAGLAGPAMHWYGLLASASIAGLVAGLIGRNEWLTPRRVAWSIAAPLLAMATVVWQLRVFFD